MSSSAVPSSSTGNGAAYSDPFFSGFCQQLFYVHGKIDEVYSLISDSSLQLNSRLVFLQNITCPVLDVPGEVHCSDHPGSYFGEIGLITRGGNTLRIQAGNVSSGFSHVLVNDVAMEIGESYGAAPFHHHRPHRETPGQSSADDEADHPARSSLFVQRTSFRSLQVHLGIYEMRIDNSDRYLDLVSVKITSWTELMQRVQPEGLLGSTWNATTPMPPIEDNHWERDNDLLGCNTPLNKFC